MKRILLFILLATLPIMANDFTDPKQAPIRHRADKIARSGFAVRVLNGSGTAGVADKVAAELTTEGYQADAAGNADSFGYTGSVVYAPADLQGWATEIAQSVHPAVIRTVQRLPGMYTRTDNPLHIMQEAIDNAADEALGGYCKRIAVIMHSDGSVTIQDDGRGIPVEIHPVEKVPTVEVADRLMVLKPIPRSV